MNSLNKQTLSRWLNILYKRQNDIKSTDATKYKKGERI